MASFFSALSFLSIIPAPTRFREASFLAYSWVWFPAVGLIVGTLAGFLFRVLLSTHVSIFLAAAGAALMLAVFTRGLHYDGFADCSDAAFGAHTKEDRLRIMKDPHLGTFAVLGLVFLILLQVGALAALPHDRIVAALAAAGLVSRWAVLRPLLYTPHPRATSLVRIFARKDIFYALSTAGTAAVGYFLAGVPALLLMLGAYVFASLFQQLVLRIFGEVTGDVCGAVIVLAELLVLLCYPLFPLA